LKSRLRPSDIIGRYVQLKKQGNEWAGLSPFTKEKTPSFFVNDHKGFFHCFSSGKHGDIISFLQETQRLSFHEAVESLAQDAGLPLPVETPDEAARARKAQGLSEACAAAADFFAKRLRRSDGRGALDYLRGRDVTDAQIDAFQIGFAPPGRADLKDHLINKGFTEDVLVDAGLIIKPEDGSQSYDRFRNRIIFPILGARERVIAFGGRALDPNARAKYLNSPETPLFHKGSVLYNYANARAASSQDKAALVVCEGYMDVIALWGAGVRRAVAPLGTALTENQLALLWRASDEPVLCFDGDKAGVGAAHRAVDRALPILKPGKSLNFAFMPEGKDPDDLVRAEGAAAFQRALDAALPLIDVLWERETTSRLLTTPERRAALKAHLRTLVRAIADKDVRNAYGAELGNRLDAGFQKRSQHQSASYRNTNKNYRSKQAGQRGRQGFRYVEPARPTADLKRRGAPNTWRREAALLLAAIRHPVLLERKEAAFLELDLLDAGLKSLLNEVLSALSSDPTLDSAGLKSHLSRSGAAGSLERILSDPELSKHHFLRPDAELDEVAQGFENALALHLFESTFKQEVAKSAAQIFDDGETAWKAAAAAREEIKNLNRAGEAGSNADADSPQRFEDALESMKISVKKKFNR
ncbi:MAG: DNA primase, partial [Hyphococcus sp.]